MSEGPLVLPSFSTIKITFSIYNSYPITTILPQCAKSLDPASSHSLWKLHPPFCLLFDYNNFYYNILVTIYCNISIVRYWNISKNRRSSYKPSVSRCVSSGASRCSLILKAAANRHNDSVTCRAAEVDESKVGLWRLRAKASPPPRRMRLRSR